MDIPTNLVLYRQRCSPDKESPLIFTCHILVQLIRAVVIEKCGASSLDEWRLFKKVVWSDCIQDYDLVVDKVGESHWRLEF